MVGLNRAIDVGTVRKRDGVVVFAGITKPRVAAISWNRADLISHTNINRVVAKTDLGGVRHGNLTIDIDIAGDNLGAVTHNQTALAGNYAIGPGFHWAQINFNGYKGVSCSSVSWPVTAAG